MLFSEHLGRNCSNQLLYFLNTIIQQSFVNTNQQKCSVLSPCLIYYNDLCFAYAFIVWDEWNKNRFDHSHQFGFGSVFKRFFVCDNANRNLDWQQNESKSARRAHAHILLGTQSQVEAWKHILNISCWSFFFTFSNY